jgi:isopentenyldiphosphate isomerase
VEQLDVVSPASGAVLDTRPRDEVHAHGLWHQVFHCLVLRPSAGSVILQRRGASKVAFPLQLDLSVTGHLATGEGPGDGVREIEEELGVTIDARELIPLGTRLLADDNGEGANRELVHVSFVLDDRPITAYRPAVGEVDGLVEILAQDLLTILADPRRAIPALECAAADPAVATPTTIRQRNLVEGSDGYWTVLAVMAQRALDGETLLSI